MTEQAEKLVKGKKAPAFTLPDKDERKISLKDFQGKWVVLYFYPRDNTSGCTTEAIDFTRARAGFRRKNAVILGVSPDSAQSHCRFAEKHGLTITLLSDPERKVLQSYGAWGIKKMYGKESMGVIRSTVIIDPAGKVAHVWRKVKVKGHVDDVAERLAQLITNPD